MDDMENGMGGMPGGFNFGGMNMGGMGGGRGGQGMAFDPNEIFKMFMRDHGDDNSMGGFMNSGMPGFSFGGFPGMNAGGRGGG